MTDDFEPPFVPRHGRVDDRRPPTPGELAHMRAILASTPRPKPANQDKKPLTDTEHRARVQAKADREMRERQGRS